MLDDEESRPKKQVFIDQRGLDPLPVLDAMSVAELRLYIDRLNIEIARVEQAITGKQGARGHADSFFKF